MSNESSRIPHYTPKNGDLSGLNVLSDSPTHLSIYSWDFSTKQKKERKTGVVV